MSWFAILGATIGAGSLFALDAQNDFPSDLMRKPPLDAGDYRPFTMPGYRGWVDYRSAAANLLSRVDRLEALEKAGGAVLIGKGRNRVFHVDADGRRLWVKVFRPRGRLSLLRYLGRRTKAEKAWNIAFALRERAIDTPRPLAGLCGDSVAGRLRACIIYEDFPCAVDIGTALDRRDALARTALLSATGRFLGRFHDAGFRHRDLQGSNLLVRESGKDVALTLIDINRTRYHPRLTMRQRLRDLERLPLDAASLDAFFDAYAPTGIDPGVLARRHAQRLRTRERLQKLPWPLNRIARRLWYYWREVTTYSPSRPV